MDSSVRARKPRRLCALGLLALFLTLPASVLAQSVPGSQAMTTEQDHHEMMEKLGIRQLRPGPAADASAPHPANYDEARANPFPDWPDPLRLSNGHPVTSADQWRKQRRPEIIAAFERDVIGKVPVNTPKVTWAVSASETERVGSVQAVASRVIGHVDNSTYPAISVEIPLMLVKPVQHTRRMPVLIMFTLGTRQHPAGQPIATPPFFPPPRPPGDPIQQLLAAGWAIALIDPTSVQADNGAGLTRGIIGLVNKGQPRAPDDWGALRAWAWGASRTYDYLATDPDLDAAHIGVEGVSRYGKAALVAMAFDERLAMVLVGSSGEGGAKPHRRNLGEAV